LLKPILILCLGNEVLRDDCFGPEVARRLSGRGNLGEGVEVIYAAVAGFALLDLLHDRKRVLVVDTIQTGKAPPGTLHYFEAGLLAPSEHLINSHQMSLPTALELGRQLQIAMPHSVDVLAVEVKDVNTLSEEMTPEVAAAVEHAIELVGRWIVQDKMEESKYVTRESVNIGR